MDDKLMDDFDTDFITGILSSSGELQMADNLMQDLMGELDANANGQMQDVDVMAGGAEWNSASGQQMNQPQMMHYSNQVAGAGSYIQQPQAPLQSGGHQHGGMQLNIAHSNQYENSNQMQMMTINTNLANHNSGHMLISPTLNQTNYSYEMMPQQQQQPLGMNQQQQQHPFLISPNNDSNSSMAPIQTQMIMSNNNPLTVINGQPSQVQFMPQRVQQEYNFSMNEMSVPVKLSGNGLQQAPVNSEMSVSHSQQMQYQQQQQHQAPPVEAVATNKRGRKNLKDILKDDNNFIKTIPTPATIAAIANRDNKQKQAFAVNQNVESLQYDLEKSAGIVKLKGQSRSISSIIGGVQNQQLSNSSEMSTTISPVLSPSNFSLPPTPQSPNSLQQHHQHHQQQVAADLKQLQAQQQQQIYLVENGMIADSKMVKIDTPPGIQIVVENSNDMMMTTPMLANVDMASQVPLSPIDFKPLINNLSQPDQSVSLAQPTKGRPSKADKNNLDKTNKTKKPKGQKRTAHNAIEKKYRSSINDKILELKTKVAGANAKLQKSGILRCALEFIGNIENMNKRLHDENQALKNALNSISANFKNPSAIQTILSSINYSSPSHKTSPMPITPPSSDPETSQTPDSPIESTKIEPPHVEKPSKRPNKMMRTVLCMCVLSVLIFNPFSLVIPSKFDDGPMFNYAQSDAAFQGVYQSGQAVNSRVLNSMDMLEDEVAATNSSGARVKNGYGFGFFVSWLLNLCLMVMLTVWLFVTGEEYANVNEKFTAVLSSYQRASKTFSQKKYYEAFESCEQGLSRLGRSVPKTKFQLVIGIFWQLTHLVLDKLVVGRWLSRYALWIHGIKSMNSFKLSALFYYELHKFSYLNLKSIDELKNLAANKTEASLLMKTFSSENGKLVQTSLFSRLSAVYYMLACYNACETYTRFEQSSEMNSRDKYNLCEFYFSFALYLTFFFPSRLSRALVNHLVNKKLLVKFADELKQDAGESSRCKLNKLKSFLNNKVFVQFINDFGYLTSFNQAYVTQAKLFGTENDFKAYIELKDLDRQKLLSLISFKRKLFASSFLYDSDDKMEDFAGNNSADKSASVGSVTGSVACDFLMTRFQDYVLFRLTDHIISQSGMISTSRIANASPSIINSNIETIDYINKNEVFEDQAEEEKANMDQQEFENIKQIYQRNLDYFNSSSGNQGVNLFTAHSNIQQDTQFILLEFLNMLNNWKLRKFNYKVHRTSELRNLKKSEFLDAVISILKAYECIFDSSDKKTVEYCKKAIDFLNNFNENKTTNGFGTNNHLVEKFELLIYDWILSSQTYLWTKKRSADLDLFNQTLKKFKKIAVNYPQINYKIQMYETVMMYTSNRNPINLVQPAKQFLFSKSNQDALYSMNFLLKKFHLQIIE